MTEKDKNIINKIQISLFMLVFFFALALTNVKPNLNHATVEQIIADINGVGKVKSTHIVKEKNENGLFKDKDDFYVRVVNNKEYKVGEVVADRIVKKYKIGE